MKLSIAISAAFAVSIAAPACAFAPQCNTVVRSNVLYSTMADSGVPPASSKVSDVQDADLPIKLPSDVGFDYVPLATALASGDLTEADQVSLITSECIILVLFQSVSISSFGVY